MIWWLHKNRKLLKTIGTDWLLRNRTGAATQCVQRLTYMDCDKLHQKRLDVTITHSVLCAHLLATNGFLTNSVVNATPRSDTFSKNQHITRNHNNFFLHIVPRQMNSSQAYRCYKPNNNAFSIINTSVKTNKK